MKRNSTYLYLLSAALLTLLALALRLFRLDAQSLWYDEGFSVYLARMSLGEITARTAADIQPPLYYFLLHGWMQLMGETETALRALSLLFGVLCVPLVLAIATYLFRSRLAGVLAALLLAISPLHIWYSQEVRMYTLLTVLTLLSSYLLLVAVGRASRRHSSGGTRAGSGWTSAVDGVLWALYAATSVAAVYTHYFAFFVLAFHGIYVLLVWGAQGFRPARLLVGGIASGAAVILAFAPWLPHLLERYGTDASYWPGQLKLHEVLVDIAVFYVGGESISEQMGLTLAAGYGLILITCLAALLVHSIRLAKREVTPGRPVGQTGRHPIAFTLLYLLLPLALILLLSYNTPKFNARYAIVSHPGLLLLTAGGLAVMLRSGRGKLATMLRQGLGTCALLAMVGTAAYANYQGYHSPDFSRADFRGVARHLLAEMEPDETVILCSGHMFPVFDLYAPGVERHLLPDSPTLDVTRTLDYSIGSDLNRWLADKGGVWVVLWQDEVVDPVGYLPALLDEVGEEQPVGQRFSQVELRHYRLPEGARVREKPEIPHPANLNFGNRLRLLGYSQSGLQQVTLYWEAVRPLSEDYLVSIVLKDTNNQVWGRWDGRPTAYLYPTTRWRVGQVVFGRYDLMPMAGTPPGDYGLDVGVYTIEDPIGLDVLDVAGAPQGKRATLGAVRLSVPAVGVGEINVPNRIEVSMGGGLELLGFDLSRQEAQPGDRLLLALGWLASATPQGDYRVQLLVTDSTGQTLDAGSHWPTNEWHPTSTWLAGQAWLGQFTFRLPLHLEPGEARVAAQLVDGSGQGLGPALDLAGVQVLPTTRSTVAPQPQVRRDASFEDLIALVGADLAPDPVDRGGTIEVTLYWHTLSEMDIPYTVFVHVLGPEGQVVAGHDGEPLGGTRPTTGWVPGEYLSDPRSLAIPADLPPGEYVIEVGWYDAGARGMPRLAVLNVQGLPEADRVIFGPVQVR